MIRRSVVLALLGGSVLAGGARAIEEKIHRTDLPPVVERAVASQHADVEKSFSREVENGRTLYEAELVVDGRSRDILIDSAGAIVEIEEEVTLASLPAEVQRGLRTSAGGGKLVKVESIKKRDGHVAYEAQIEKKGKRSEIQVGPDGKRLGHAE